MKVNVNIPDDVLSKTDLRVKQLGISRSAFITMTLSEKLMQSNLLEVLPEMLETMKKLSDNDGK